MAKTLETMPSLKEYPLPDSRGTHAAAPISPMPEADRAPPPAEKILWNFAPRAQMSTSLSEAVRMVAPIAVTANTDLNRSPIAGYRTPGTVDPSGQNKEWWQSSQGRLSTRLFSRGVAGSLAYAMASIASERALGRYDMTKAIGDAEHYSQPGTNQAIHRFIRGIAKTYDLTLGKAVYGTVKLFSNETRAQQAITFRNTREFGVNGQLGRSLGHEIVDVAFNFAAASVGDAMGRNFAQLIDPHKEISWIKDGKFDWKKCATAQGQAAWKIMTYNQGEDWFSSMFYVYTMKAQRQLLDRTSWGRGFKHVFDNGNTDAYRVNDQGKIVGDYYWQNILDYQLRFTNYNVLTLMYREMYNSVGDRLNHWMKTGELPETHHAKTAGEAVGNFFGGAKDFGVYVGRSIMKGYLLMTFTVPFFSFIRVPQSKHRALAIHPEHGPLMIDASQALNGKATALTPNFRNSMNAASEHSDGHKLYSYDKASEHFTELPGDNRMKLHFYDGHGAQGGVTNPYALAYTPKDGRLRWFDPYTQQIDGLKGGGIGRRISDGIGRVSYNISRSAYDWLVDVRYGMRLDSSGGKEVAERRALSDQALKEATLQHINSAMAYTPYFAAKTEFAELWDKKETDQAMDRLMNGIFTLRAGEVAGGARDTVNAILHPGKTAGLGSVYGVDVNTNAGWMPWSRKIETQKNAAKPVRPALLPQGETQPESAPARPDAAGYAIPAEMKETTRTLALDALARPSPESTPDYVAKLGQRSRRVEFAPGDAAHSHAEKAERTPPAALAALGIR